MTLQECEDFEGRIRPERRYLYVSWFAWVRAHRINGIPWKQEIFDGIKHHGLTGYRAGCRCRKCMGAQDYALEYSRAKRIAKRYEQRHKT